MPDTHIIYKYRLKVIENQILNLPQGAEILHAGVQDGVIFLWAELIPSAPLIGRHIEIRGTGQLFERRERRHLATVHLGDLVWHIFERL